MIPIAFDYVRPSTVDEAISALAAAGEDGKVISGGQSLMPVLRLRMAAPTTLVDIGSIAEMKGVTDGGDHLVVGANATHYEVMNDKVGEAFVRDAGFNRWADVHRVAVLYPQVRSSYLPLNPKACWDWWGYTGEAYDTRDGAQLRWLAAALTALGAPMP